MSDELAWMGLTEIGARLARREISAVALTQAMLERIDRLNGGLHAFLTITPERALADAAAADAALAAGQRPGPLHGVPIAVKDLCATRGVRTTCGSSVLADWVPDHDAAVVERLAAAGAVLLGKLNLTEFALTGYHPDMPEPRNPWDPSRATGGSSSGSGVAVAAGLCFAAIGSDTGGSIRFPSAWCGVVGLKPTYGRVSRFGVFPLAASLDHVGPMTRRVADAAAMLDAIAGPDPRDPTTLRTPPPSCVAALGGEVRGLRIGWDRDFVAAGAPPDVIAAVEAALATLTELGAEVVEVAMPPVAPLLEGWLVACAAEAAVAHQATWPARAAAYGATFRAFLEWAATLRAADYAAVHQARLEWNGRLAALFERVDLLACPSAFQVAPPAALLDPQTPLTPAVAPFLRFTAPFDFSGHPTLSVPCGFTPNGLPHSLQLVGRHGDEPLLCRVGHAYESATEWHRRHPPLDASPPS